MSFIESIKKEVKKKAHYKCCICESFEFLHVHHIVPKEKKGLDTIDNAAPLCTRCHDAYGGNPEKRKWIKEKRDFWYELCEKKLQGEDLNAIQKAYDIIENIKTENDKKFENIEQKMDILNDTIQFYANTNAELLAKLNDIPENERTDLFTQVNSVSNIVAGSTSAFNQLNACVNPYCSNCGEHINSHVSICPSCGGPVLRL